MRGTQTLGPSDAHASTTRELLASLPVVMVALRRETRTEPAAEPAYMNPFGPAWHFLVAGFGMLTALGIIRVVTGFLVHDLLALDADMTASSPAGRCWRPASGWCSPRASSCRARGGHPPTLLRVGTCLGAMGFALLAVDGGLVLIVISVTMIGMGIGIATPGYTAGPTLLMNREEQGGLAGLIGATNGLTYVVSPTAGTAMYGLSPILPIAVGGAILVAVLVFVLIHRGFRRAPESAPKSAATGAARGD